LRIISLLDLGHILDILLVHTFAVSTTAQAYFGEGTKLTVLGKKHTSSYFLNDRD